MRKLLFSMFALPLCGCFWVVRCPFPTEEKFSDSGECTNRVWKCCIDDKQFAGKRWSVYPLIGLRVYLTKELGKDDDIPIEELNARYPERYYDGRDIWEIKWQRRFRWGQYALAWLGLPFDLVADTLFLPYDVYLMFD